mmetsp:Transcript_1572/g.2428  ORF Transcript_1572/g.2428 Transcript_1572/m.2428 type:complete len:169 (+) Transcript_1572:63-569(+)|eukprot:CAMPEP_0178739948 /NCGR_PEP_ID=MMETSP0744-20121128/4329_1 /TAXON_ID=913974 /ORGANISM="Nitzschia punctata, Strain CCMP561" /LENGTH=168 /DNA_ID=CAMNT_0020392689 /DNA_START=40 /DNA_END=546 /DNA_ORIENTATION=+
MKRNKALNTNHNRRHRTFSFNVCTGISSLVAILFIFKFFSSTSMFSSSVDMPISTSGRPGGVPSEVGGFAFEIYGKVQQVSFRKYTQKQAREIGEIVGWIRNTEKGTVEGEVASRSVGKRQALQEWLRTTGSPKSRIESAHFEDLSFQRAEEMLNEMDDFKVAKTKRR